MNQNLKDLALQVGGSHYPEVSKQYLPLTIKLVLETMTQQNLTPEQTKEYFGL